MKTLIIFTTFILLINLSFQVTNVIFYLEPNEELCLHEYFSDKTLVIYEAHFNVTEGIAKIRDPDEKILADKERISTFKEAFTTFSGGYYEICLTNKDRENIAEVNFSMKHGVAAKDYSAVAKAKDLKPMELDLHKLEDKSKELSHYIAFAAAHEAIFEGILDGLASKVSFFSFTIIGVMIIVGVLETAYLKNYLNKRKNI
jgi:hypothetical protein